MRVCRDCREEKPQADFVRDARRPSGYTNVCKPCHATAQKERDRKSPDRRRAYFREYNQTAARKAKQAAYRANDGGAARIRSREYYRTHKDRWIAWRDKSPAQQAEANARSSRHKALKRTDRAGSVRAMVAWEALCKLAGCEYCGDPAVHLEHMTPLSAGGPHTVRNTTGSCASCNLTKGPKAYPDEWAGPFSNLQGAS